MLIKLMLFQLRGWDNLVWSLRVLFYFKPVLGWFSDFGSLIVFAWLVGLSGLEFSTEACEV